MRLEMMVENSYRERCPADAVRLFTDTVFQGDFFRDIVYFRFKHMLGVMDSVLYFIQI